MRLKSIKVFNDKYPLLGPLIWCLSVQYFIFQYIVARHWPTPYRLSRNTISDLGNSACGLYRHNYICSPWHSLMNASFILLGLTMASGSLLIYQEFRQNRAALMAFSLMALAGLGTVLVGLFPENSIGWLHELGASLPFLLGNIGLVVVSRSLYGLPSRLRLYTLLSGSLALMALGFYVSHHYGRIGQGGVERLVAYPQTIWLMVFGLYMFRSHYLKIGGRS